jgi:hypothetical protein
MIKTIYLGLNSEHFDYAIDKNRYAGPTIRHAFCTRPKKLKMASICVSHQLHPFVNSNKKSDFPLFI